MSHFQIVNLYCELIPSLLACLFIGPISDKIGRTPIIKLAFLGFLIQHMLHFLTIHYNQSIEWFYVASFISGFGGAETGVRIACMAYVIDTCEDPKALAFKLGLCPAGTRRQNNVVATSF